MAAGAEQRLDDYYYLRHTYDTVSSKEINLPHNRTCYVLPRLADKRHN